MRLLALLATSGLFVPAILHSQTRPAFKHIIIVFQENRTPDNLFGSNPTFEPGVDIARFGVTSAGVKVPLAARPLDDCYDIVHSHASFEYALTQGFDLEPLASKHCPTALPANPQFKYVDNSTGTVQPYFDIAENYGFANRMFQTNQGPSFPAHQFIFSGTSAPLPSSNLFAAENTAIVSGGTVKSVAGCLAPANQTVAVIDPAGVEKQQRPVYPCFERNTLGDVLDAANPKLSWRYYAPAAGSFWTAPDAINHICQAKKVGGVATCTGPQWTNDVVPNNPAQVLTDISACNLPAVSWVTPTADESDHAGVNKGKGPQWVASIVDAVGQQPTCTSGETYWNDTAIFIAWDDWGGWFDHVKPVLVNTDQNSWGSGYTYGFRVPLMVVSAFTPAHLVSNSVFDFGSVLYFIEQNFHLGFIGPGTGTFSQYADYQSSKPPFGSLADFFPLTAPKLFAPISTTMTKSDFIDAPPSNVPVDDD